MLRGLIHILLGSVDFVLFYAAKPVGFLWRSIHDGIHAGFYSEEYKLMATLSAEQVELQEPDNDE